MNNRRDARRGAGTVVLSPSGDVIADLLTILAVGYASVLRKSGQRGRDVVHPQWVYAAVSSYKITTKLRVLPLGLVQDSAGDLSPPRLPSIEHSFVVLFGGNMLKIALIGRNVSLSNVLLLN